MSCGDKDNPFPSTLAETRAILRLPVVERIMLNRRIRVVPDGWDIPYLAGYSKDGSKIYVDRDLTDWDYGGREINTGRFLRLHEEVEKALIDAVHEAKGHDLHVLLACLRMKSPTDDIYLHCHGVATCVELYAVEETFGPAGVAAYNNFMRHAVKKAEDERIRRVPKDLDLTPYQDKKLRDAMKKKMS